MAGNSGPHQPVPSQFSSPFSTRPVEEEACSPPLRVQGELDPYGEPRTLAQMIKKRVGSKSLPGPSSGPHLYKHKRDHELFLSFKLKPSFFLPVLYVSAACESMTDNECIVFSVRI